MINRPNEKDQIYIVINNLLPIYNTMLLSSPITFEELCDYRTRIKDAINTGKLKKGESKFTMKKIYGGGSFNAKAPNLVSMSVIISQQPITYQSFTKKARREFSDLGMTLTKAYENLTSKGHKTSRSYSYA